MVSHVVTISNWVLWSKDWAAVGWSFNLFIKTMTKIVIFIMKR